MEIVIANLADSTANVNTTIKLDIISGENCPINFKGS